MITINDFIYSETAIKHNIDNTISDEHYLNCVGTIAMLNMLEQKIGKKFIITSGYRCSELNKRVGGVPNSDHTKGLACDIVVVGVTSRDLCHMIIESGIPFNKIINEFDRWVHIAFSTDVNKRQVMHAKKVNGKTQYLLGVE